MWNHAVFSKNRDRLLTSDVAQQFFAEVNRQARRFMSDEQFTVDGTLIQAWASQQSFRSKDCSDDGDGTDFHGQSRSNKTHESTTDANMAQANRPAAPGQVARPGESGLAVRLQLRGPQPDPDAETDGSTTSKAHGAVCLNHECGPRARFRQACNTL